MVKTELATAMRSGDYTLAGMALDTVCNDAEWFLEDWTSDSQDNFLHYENSAYDTLMSIISVAQDNSARMGCLHDAEDLLLEIDWRHGAPVHPGHRVAAAGHPAGGLPGSPGLV